MVGILQSLYLRKLGKAVKAHDNAGYRASRFTGLYPKAHASSIGVLVKCGKNAGPEFIVCLAYTLTCHADRIIRIGMRKIGRINNVCSGRHETRNPPLS